MAPATEAAVKLPALDPIPSFIETDLTRYREQRARFYAKFPDFWPDTHGKEYALYGAYPISIAERDAIHQAAAAIWQIYQRVAPLLRSVPDDTLLDLGLHPSTLSLARTVIPGMPETVIGRLDMVRTPDGYRMLEFNTDTPTFVVEAFDFNQRICHHFGVEDLNAGGRERLASALDSAIRAGLNYVGKQPGDSARVAFTSFGTDEEDRATTEFMRGLADPLPGCELLYFPIESLRVDEDGLYGPDGARIDVLYRLYPIEFFARDKEPETAIPIGEIVFHLVEDRRLAFINPPSAFLLQGKGVQAAIWGLLEAGTYFDTKEQELIRRHFLPTYLDPVFEAKSYVVKPVYGREGDSVFIHHPAAGETVGSSQANYQDQPMVYQQYYPLPPITVMTEDEIQNLPALTSCFVVGGEPVGITIRAGGPITDNASRFVPLYRG